MDEVAYAVLVGTGEAATPITAEAEAEKPTRTRRAFPAAASEADEDEADEDEADEDETDEDETARSRSTEPVEPGDGGAETLRTRSGHACQERRGNRTPAGQAADCPVGRRGRGRRGRAGEDGPGPPPEEARRGRGGRRRRSRGDARGG